MDSENRIHEYTLEFIGAINSLRAVYPKVYNRFKIDFEINKVALERFNKDNKPICDTGDKHPLPPKKWKESIILEENYEHDKYALKNLPSALLVSMVAKYDFFIKSMLKRLFYVRKDLLGKFERAITAKELVDIENYDRVFEYVVEAELDRWSIKPHQEQIKWIEQIFGTSLLSVLERDKLWAVFNEARWRRDLYLTNGSIATEHYLHACQDYWLHNENSPIVGEDIVSDESYVNQVYEMLFQVGIRVSQLTWRANCGSRSVLREADETIHDVTYNLLVLNEYQMANQLFRFIKADRIYSTDKYKRIFLINLAQTFKWLGDFSACSNILAKEDWSACSNAFLIAELVLLDKFAKAVELMTHLVNTKELTEVQFVEWPLFKEFRKQEIFKSKYKELFGRELL